MKSCLETNTSPFSLLNILVNSSMSLEELAVTTVVARAIRAIHPFSHIPRGPLATDCRGHAWALDPARRLNLDALNLFGFALFAFYLWQEPSYCTKNTNKAFEKAMPNTIAILCPTGSSRKNEQYRHSRSYKYKP